jgi:hypothetical protein
MSVKAGEETVKDYSSFEFSGWTVKDLSLDAYSIS